MSSQAIYCLILLALIIGIIGLFILATYTSSDRLQLLGIIGGFSCLAMFSFLIVIDPSPSTAEKIVYSKVNNLQVLPESLVFSDNNLTIKGTYIVSADSDIDNTELRLSNISSFEGIDKLKGVLSDDRQCYNLITLSIKPKDISFFEYLKIGFNELTSLNRNPSLLYKLEFITKDNTGYLELDGKLEAEIKDKKTCYSIGDYLLVANDSNSLASLSARDNVHIELVYDKSTVNDNVIYGYKILNAK